MPKEDETKYADKVKLDSWYQRIGYVKGPRAVDFNDSYPDYTHLFSVDMKLYQYKKTL